MINQTDGLAPVPDATLISAESIAPPPRLSQDPPQALMMHGVFIGRDGLRAGWSLLIFVALFAAIIACVNTVAHKLHPPTPHAANATFEMIASPRIFIEEAIPFLVAILVAWIMSKIEGRRNSVYGLGGDRMLSLFLGGLAWGITCISLLVAALLKTGLLVIDGRLLSGSAIFRFGAVWLIGFLLVGLLEEFLTRGYVQYTLSRGLTGIYQWLFKTRHSATLGFWSSAVIFSFLFGLGHSKNPGESPIGLLAAGLAAMVFCFSLWRTGSLWWAIGFHTSWDWGQSFLYGVADSGAMVKPRLLATHPAGQPVLSGGTTGPEGSIFIIAVLAVVCLIIVLTLPRRVQGGDHMLVEPAGSQRA